MKKYYLIRNLIVALLLLAAVGFAAEMCCAQDNSAKVNELAALLGRHDDALNQKDLDGLMALYAEGANTTMMGTGPGERWEGKEAIKEAFGQIIKDYDKGSQSHSCYWKAGGINGDMAWIAAMCTMSDKLKNRKREYELNISAVFEKQNDKWLVRSMHYSNVVSGKKP
jgi:uncharacterized protein (TIGR02246 family)